MPKSKSTGKKKVRFAIEGDKGNEVYVAGTFNDWNPTKNKLRWKDGVYATTILLAEGKYEYKFVVNGTWCVDPECMDWAPNSLGSLNSVKNVG